MENIFSNSQRRVGFSRKSNSIYGIPETSTILEQGYVVLKDQIIKDTVGEDISQTRALEPIYNTLKQIESLSVDSTQDKLNKRLVELAQSEYNKEIAFLTYMYNDLEQDNDFLVSDLKNEIQKVIRQNNNSWLDLTEVFTLLELGKNGMEYATKNLGNLYASLQFGKNLSRFINVKILTEVYDRINVKTITKNTRDIELNLTEITKEIIRGVQILDLDYLNSSGTEELNKQINEMLDRIGLKTDKTKILGNGDHVIKLGDFIDFDAIKIGDPNTLKQTINKKTHSIGNGILSEVVGVLISNGAILGRGNQKVTGSDFNQVTKQVSMTDNQSIIQFSAKFKSKPNIPELDNLIDGSKQLNDTLKNISNKFEIHRSVKTYMPRIIDAQTNDTKFSNLGIRYNYQIKSGSLKNRLEELNNIHRDGPQLNEIDKLIFMLQNIGDGAFYSGSVKDQEMITTALATVAYVWMFDDVADMTMASADDFLEQNSESSNILHIFDLNKIYVPISTILFSFADQLKNLNRVVSEDLIQVKISNNSSPIKYYSESIRNSNIKNGTNWERWNILKRQAQENTSVSIKLNKIIIEKYLNGIDIPKKTKGV